MEQPISEHHWNARDYAANASAQYRWASELISKLALAGEEQLLDIGCGDGRISAELARALPRGRVHGIDASSAMIDEARRAYPAADHPNLTFTRMDARRIKLDGQFDVAFSNAALHWVDDHEAVLQGLHQALRPGGRLLFQMGGKGNGADFFEAVASVMSKEGWRDYFAGFRSPYHFYDTADYARWLKAHGFAAVRIELVPKTMSHASSDGLRGWFRTTWFPYTDCLPAERREEFIKQVIKRYLVAHPPAPDGATAVEMVRLEVEARRL